MVLYNRAVYGKITKFLYNYERYVKEYLELEEDIIYKDSYKITSTSWIQAKNKESDILEEQAEELHRIKNMQAKKMIDAISKAIALFEREDKLKLDIIRFKYFNNKSESEILKEIHIERSRYFEKCAEILNLIALLGTANGAITEKELYNFDILC